MIPEDSTVNCSAGVFLLTDFQYFGLHVVSISQTRWGEGGEKIFFPLPLPLISMRRGKFHVQRRMFH